MGLYCGIDLHSNNHVLTVIDEADRRVYERRLPNELAKAKEAWSHFARSWSPWLSSRRLTGTGWPMV